MLHGEIVDGPLLIAGGDASKVLNAVNGAFDLVALTMDLVVKGTFTAPVGPLGYRKTNAATTE